MITDRFGRTINYLRLAVTDKCNLRCFYCMPQEGLNWLSRAELLSYPEMLRICSLLVRMGVEKIRITGGEPFVRKDIMPFLAEVARFDGLRRLTVTTNGVLTAPLVPELKKMGIHSVNLSLDTLDRDRFFAITYRDEHDAVMQTLEQLLHHNMEVKINAVVMEGKNTQDIIPLAALTKDLPVQVRFIEQMPFNGREAGFSGIVWNHHRILEELQLTYPAIRKLVDPPFSTAYNYQIPGHKGSIGIIAAYTRSFCGSCNRIRITAQGTLKTCLYGTGVLSIRDLFRNGLPDEEVGNALQLAIQNRERDGWQAEEKSMQKNGMHESMAEIGG
ncbi:MAG: GTP 3',8-cyclase MoaA [Williamsia sp.]|nr:GTP 3',8-cyclase MoaA [Williamsia sp.]